MQPVLATSTYVYALQNSANEYHPVPCMVRYPVDAQGFGPAEDFCNLGNHWGKYPEMKIYAGTLVLQNQYHAYGIADQPDAFGSMLIVADYDPKINLSASPFLVSFSPGSGSYRIALTRLGSGEAYGVYPKYSTVGYPTSVVFVDDQAMLFYISLAQNVIIIPKWKNAIQPYF
jgi:hypothetical protein